MILVLTILLKLNILVLKTDNVSFQTENHMTTMTQTTQTQTKFNLSQPLLFSHLNGLALFIGSIIAYGIFSGDWLAFILLLLAPDFSALGYLVNKTIGTWSYNIVHSYPLAIITMVAGYALGIDSVISIGIILMAHISMDQTFGYGYKYADAEFSDTHYKRI
jgi:hypothetical protein